MKLTYDRLREITERAENAIDEETYLKTELEEVIDEMTECWAEIERLKEENDRLNQLGNQAAREQEYAKEQCLYWNEESLRYKAKLQDALNTLKETKNSLSESWKKGWFEESGDLIIDVTDNLEQAIDRLQGSEPSEE